MLTQSDLAKKCFRFDDAISESRNFSGWQKKYNKLENDR
jgi:hypothetical protein